jgi:hypothetical protein
LRVWNTWNNFDRSGLRQFKTDADSFREFRPKFRVFCHLDVFVGHGLSDYFTVARLGVARPVPYEGGWHATRFKMCDAETAEAVEALFLDSEFFKNRVQRATKEVRLEEGRPCARLEEKAPLPVANKIAEHRRYGRMQVHLTESVCRLRSLDSTFPYGLFNRDCVAVEVLHFETEQFACPKATSPAPSRIGAPT